MPPSIIRVPGRSRRRNTSGGRTPIVAPAFGSVRFRATNIISHCMFGYGIPANIIALLRIAELTGGCVATAQAFCRSVCDEAGFRFGAQVILEAACGLKRDDRSTSNVARMALFMQGKRPRLKNRNKIAKPDSSQMPSKPILIECPHCRCPVRESRMRWHIRREHPSSG